MKEMPPNIGKRRKIDLEGEHYYLLVTAGADGWTVEISAGHDVPPYSRTRRAIEALVEEINKTIQEVRDAS